ncbi:MAG: hypothetical protein CO042_03550 [Parcubacteria group bacterium CG_4_9_14_0_2_um_filter_41_8]|nr:MAG: hypothetical protein COV79_05275 [Parcubacteria group bacterium CG11_big_fil_rev_8_21_14_0_20_41_14]PIR56885.1 MAG: hypothetical protein COU72_03855 [Parcubacteria group bacterium CG10_big_fil_rev_8_21_14_0_10_41_35]PJC40487.1 MAG: hypothetical protein CO042_03550 [Parcubacteria group bacterium CG_4_9_14_0_2_um_filter_41_8]
MAKSGKFLFGALLGATAAALLTPFAGKKARQKLSKTAKKVTEDERVSGLIEKGEQVFDKAKKSAQDAFDRASETSKEKVQAKKSNKK